MKESSKTMTSKAGSRVDNNVTENSFLLTPSETDQLRHHVHHKLFRKRKIIKLRKLHKTSNLHLPF